MINEFIIIDKLDCYNKSNISNFLIIDYPYLFKNNLLNDVTYIDINFDKFKDSILDSFLKSNNKDSSTIFKNIWNQFEVDFKRSLFFLNNKVYHNTQDIRKWLFNINDFDFGINLLIFANQCSFAIPLEIIYKKFNLFDNFHVGELNHDEHKDISKKMSIYVEYNINNKIITLSKPLRIFKINQSLKQADKTISIFQLDIIINIIDNTIKIKICWL